MRRGRGDGGAALVEFAIVMPLLFLIIFGIIDFGWAYYQSLDARHAAREGARLAAVDYHFTLGSSGATQTAELRTQTCNRMDNHDDASVGFYRSGSSDVGERLQVRVQLDLNSLTGFMDAFVPNTITSTVSSRLEQEAHWQNAGSATEVTKCPA